jgi:hypothetical protein
VINHYNDLPWPDRLLRDAAEGVFDLRSVFFGVHAHHHRSREVRARLLYAVLPSHL